MSGEILTASVTPARSSVPAASPPPLAPAMNPTRMNAPIIADMTAATGEPMPIASPALAADERDPSAADVNPAPSSARPGRLISATIAPASTSSRGTADLKGGATTAATTTRIPKMAADASAPRRAARMPARRRPVGSGRQFGSHGPTRTSLAA